MSIKSGLFFTLFLLVLSLSSHADTLTAPDDTSDEYEDSFIVPPVEIGASGHLRKETPRRSEVEAENPVHFHAMWESRYITEGRDNLNEDSLSSISTDLTRGAFSFVPWFAHSAAADYTEFNLNLIYGLNISDHMELYLGYTYLDFEVDGIDSNDHEASVELSYTAIESVQLGLSLVYADEASGTYGELFARYDFSLLENISACISSSVGYNDGYVADAHQGFDHLQLRACAVYFPWSRLEISAYLAATRVIDKNASRYIEDTLLKNYHWAGVSASYRF